MSLQTVRAPHFSVVIPLFNREREILRAIRSCLSQDFADFEIVVVDDASTDGSAAAVESVDDERVRLIRGAKNRGECPSRNAGVTAALGEWIVFLDSDDELLPGCLGSIFPFTSRADGVDRFGSMYQHDDGRLSPDPLPQASLLGLPEWVSFMEHARLSDALWVTRRATFEHCRLPESRVSPMSYHLDFAARYRTRLVPKVLALLHSDSPNRLSVLRRRQDWARVRERAKDDAANLCQLLARHGDALSRYAPRKHGRLRRALVVSQTIAGSRRQALRAALQFAADDPLRAQRWGLLILSALGGRATDYARRHHPGAAG